MGVRIGTRWRIRLNRPHAAPRRRYGLMSNYFDHLLVRLITQQVSSHVSFDVDDLFRILREIFAVLDIKYGCQTQKQMTFV